MNDDEDWEILKAPKSFRIKSKLYNYYCKSRYIFKFLHMIYKNGAKGARFINQVIWINYSLYPYLPPKISLLLSIVMVSIFMMSFRQN